VLRHEHPLGRTIQEQEQVANIEAVRVPRVGKGMSEAEALREILTTLGRQRAPAHPHSPGWRYYPEA
jgi:hypothetical protein